MTENRTIPSPSKGARVQHKHTRRMGTVYRARGVSGNAHVCVLFDGDKFTLPVAPDLLQPVQPVRLDSVTGRAAS